MIQNFIRINFHPYRLIALKKPAECAHCTKILAPGEQAYKTETKQRIQWLRLCVDCGEKAKDKPAN